MWDNLNLTPEQMAHFEGNEEWKSLSDEPRDYNLEDIELSSFEEKLPCPEAGTLEVHEVISGVLTVKERPDDESNT